MRKSKQSFAKANRKREEHIGVRWTCGGTFRLGERNQEKRFSIARSDQNLPNHNNIPPAVPPRHYQTNRKLTKRSTKIHTEYAQPKDHREVFSAHQLNWSKQNLVPETEFLSRRNRGPSQCHTASNREKENEYLIPIQHKQQSVYHHHAGNSSAENRKQFEDGFDLIPIRNKSSATSLHSQSISDHGAHQAKRKQIMEKMLRVLEEFESLDQNTSKDQNVVSWKNLHSGQAKSPNQPLLTHDLLNQQTQNKAETYTLFNENDTGPNERKMSKYADTQHSQLAKSTPIYLLAEELQVSTKHAFPTMSSASTANPYTQHEKKNTDDDYSLLSMCSSGKSMMLSLDPAKRGYKNRKMVTKDATLDRKKSSDSMFVSVDSSDNLTNDVETTYLRTAPQHYRPRNKTIDQTVMRRRSGERAQQNQLKYLKSQLRKSMPSYKNHHQRSPRRTKTHKLLVQTHWNLCQSGFGNDKILTGNENMSDVSQFSHSGSELENNGSTIERNLPKFELRKMENFHCDDTSDTASCKAASHSLRKDSVASVGSVSVSSIEFEKIKPYPQHHVKDISKKSLKVNVEMFLKDDDGAPAERPDNIPSTSESRYQKQVIQCYDADAKAKRSYFDVLESSADELSTDIEMIDFGTM